MDTTSCFSVFNLHYDQNNFSNEIKFFPNPANDLIYILSDKDLYDCDLVIYNSFGTEVYYKKLNLMKNEKIEIKPDLRSGNYYMKISNDDSIFSKSLMFFQ